jgi:ABC-type multidrug transport system permease subunit
MQFKRQHMRDAYTFWTAHAIPPVAKLDLPSCQWKRQHVILLLVQRVLVFVTSDSFSFFFLLSLLPKRYMLVLFVFGISISVLIILIYNFFWSFYKNFICSQFSTLITICHILSFPIQSLFL